MDFYIVEIVGFVLVVIWFNYRDVSNLYEIRILQKRCRLIEGLIEEVLNFINEISKEYVDKKWKGKD